MPRRARVLVLDNLDSFTYNLVQILRAQGAAVAVRRAGAAGGLKALKALKPSHLVLSPGPGRPEGARESLAAIKAFAGRIPVLGVCLGHQALALVFGGSVGRAARPVHGRASAMRHDGQGIFKGLPNPFLAGRYHSLAVHPAGLPPALKVSAWTGAGEIMGLRHASGAEGVQFHPESILTPCGPRLLANFLQSPS
ncbi:MAG TPA: aminodeoxychorismate/anthranilate synthase component II [bacterium]|jgi:anthranilate synthase/aminodeoxychorismate synthase-like glutamine amidotransferase|nr:aminodeoxychorismate/anthranilate synthase component II [bacterium]